MIKINQQRILLKGEKIVTIRDRILPIPIYNDKNNINEQDRLYYIFDKDSEYITISGVGDDPHNLEDIRLSSSKGARSILEQILEIESGYSPQIGFVKFDDYPNDIYIQIARFQSIYKDGWRFKRSNLSDESDLGKMQSKKRVYVKASKRAKSHYRMQTVGREEIDPVDNLWEITKDQFSRLISGDKRLLKEKYIEEHNYEPNEPHPELERLIGMMDDHMKNTRIPFLDSFDETYIHPHEMAIWRALDSDEVVPLSTIKDYPDIMVEYKEREKQEKDNPGKSWAVNEWKVIENPVKVTKLWEMPKSEYDSIMESVRRDYSKDPKKITDTMLNKYYADELDDVKRAAKLRKKIFDNLPKQFQSGYTPETMNAHLHGRVISYMIQEGKNIPISVKKEYPMIFKEVSINFEATGNKNTDKIINETLETIRDKIDDVNDHNQLSEAIASVIGSSGEIVPMEYGILSKDEKKLIQSGVKDISGYINPKLLNKIKDNDVKITMIYDKNRSRSNFKSSNKCINLGKSVINTKYVRYNKNTICHEYGHAIEDMVPEIKQLCGEFLNHRTVDESFVELLEIMPNMGYEDNEVTKVDHFIDAYIGKHYSDDCTEVLSMGIGYLTSMSDKMILSTEDPEYLGFVVSILAGKIGLND